LCGDELQHADAAALKLSFPQVAQAEIAVLDGIHLTRSHPVFTQHSGSFCTYVWLVSGAVMEVAIALVWG
jgi:hypothetical protein